ncbi:unnamed protein product [Albugo candida]|nr:unnamed protein product [Albugo candida]|eukprot:CCI49179.1 unnamed protein product [Albugo candida]
MQITVNDPDIRKYEPPLIRRIFEVFIEKIMGITKEEMGQPAFSGLRALDFPELHEESIPELTFFRTISKLMGYCGIYDFSFRDLLYPSPKRLRRQLSALINFAKFREERLSTFAGLSKETEDILIMRSRQQDENIKLEAELNDLQQERVAEEPAIEQLTQECQAYEQEINTLNTKQATLRHETGLLRNKTKELRSEIATYDAQILDAQEEIKRLENQIVTSPDRIKVEISHIATTVEEAREEVMRHDKRQRELLLMRDTFQRTEKDMKKTIQGLLDLEILLNKCKQAKQNVHDLKSEMECNQQKAIEYLSQRKRLEKVLDAKQRDLVSYKEEASIMMQAAENALEAARQELQQVENAQSNAHDRIATNHSKRREIERQCQEKEAKYQRQVLEVKEMFQRLNNAVTYYNQAMIQAMKLDPPRS